jgi:nucleotide-binding universal stress UspA family protein
MQPLINRPVPQVKKVLVALDFRTPPEKYVRWIRYFAGRYKATIYLVAVAPDMTSLSNFFPPHARFQEKVTQKTQIKLESFIAKHLPEFPDVLARVLTGREADQILATARQENVDLIIMGTYGRTGFNRLLLGSVAEKLVHAAPCPVFILEPK